MQPQSLTSSKFHNTLQVEGFEVSGNGFGECVENKLIESISSITKVLEQMGSGVRADMVWSLWGYPRFLVCGSTHETIVKSVFILRTMRLGLRNTNMSTQDHLTCSSTRAEFAYDLVWVLLSNGSRLVQSGIGSVDLAVLFRSGSALSGFRALRKQVRSSSNISRKS